ncbi:MAG: T9SS type A sorting domain-containing protein [Bacteroidota bacterium]
MKKLIFISWFLLYFFIKSKAQYFGLNFNDKNFYSVSLPYPVDGNYRALVYDLSYPLTPTFVPIVKVYNTSYHLVQTKSMIKGMIPFENPPLKIGGKLLWPCNYWDTTSISTPKFQLSILETDTLYNFLALNKYGQTITNPNYNYEPSGLVKYLNGYIVTGMTLDSVTSYFKNRFYKLNNNFIKMDSADFPATYYLQNGFTSNNKFYVRSENGYTLCPSSVSPGGTIMEMDTAFHILNCKSMNGLLTYTCKNNGGTYINQIGIIQPYYSKVIALTPNKQLILGNADVTCSYGPINYNNESVMVNSILAGNQIIKTNVFQTTGKNLQYIDHRASYIDVKYKYFITVGSSGFGRPYPIIPPPFFPYFVEQKSTLFVNKTDTMGNIIWTKEYGGEMNYYGRGIAFTPDGGCIITGTRYDSTSMFAQHLSQNFILKLDSNGNYNSVGIFDNGQLRSNLVTCYPNPSKTQIHFDVPFENVLSLQIFNQMGQLILEEKNYQSLKAIDVKGLSADLYYYKIVTKQNTYSGKFVKE